MNVVDIDRIHATLSKRIASTQGRPSVIVGYTANYALYVHEDLTARHGAAYNAAYITQEERVITRGKNKGNTKVVDVWTAEARQRGYHKNELGEEITARTRGENQTAKYLEKPAREFKTELGVIAQKTLQARGSVRDALVMAGLRLMRESQLIVPVDTGNLKNSAFVRDETNNTEHWMK
jgi:hypothetical protein